MLRSVDPGQHRDTPATRQVLADRAEPASCKASPVRGGIDRRGRRMQVAVVEDFVGHGLERLAPFQRDGGGYRVSVRHRRRHAKIEILGTKVGTTPIYVPKASRPATRKLSHYI